MIPAPYTPWVRTPNPRSEARALRYALMFGERGCAPDCTADTPCPTCPCVPFDPIVGHVCDLYRGR